MIEFIIIVGGILFLSFLACIFWAKAQAAAEEDDDDDISVMTFDDILPQPGEWEYNIAGTNFRHLTYWDIGYSDRFSIRAEPGNPFDDHAVAVYKKRKKVGYIERGCNEKWFDHLTGEDCPTSVIACRGYIGRYRPEQGKRLVFYGRVFLPKIQQGRQRKKKGAKAL